MNECINKHIDTYVCVYLKIILPVLGYAAI